MQRLSYFPSSFTMAAGVSESALLGWKEGRNCQGKDYVWLVNTETWRSREAALRKQCLPNPQ